MSIIKSIQHYYHGLWSDTFKYTLLFICDEHYFVFINYVGQHIKVLAINGKRHNTIIY